MNFIKTNNEDTANMLKQLGYMELSKEGSFWVFANTTGKTEFADKKDIIYTNKISI